jgi:hypothetical protein
VLANLESSRDGVEQAVHATAQRIAQFEQQLEVVKATEAMQRAQQAVTTSTLGASSSGLHRGGVNSGVCKSVRRNARPDWMLLRNWKRWRMEAIR